jgi:hypothetical protein
VAGRTHSVVWQGKSFDHILRSDEDLMKKAEYVLRQPGTRAACRIDR